MEDGQPPRGRALQEVPSCHSRLALNLVRVPSSKHSGVIDAERERDVKPVERIAYVAGGLLVLSGLVHLAVLVVGGASWDGPVSLRKPMTFGLSFGLTLINVTLIASAVSVSARARTLLIGSFATACVVETLLVSMQAWRGVPSHFNMETPFDAAVAQTLAVGGLVLVLVIVTLTVLAFRTRTPRTPGLLHAIRAGLVALVGAQVAGAAMIATGVRLVVGGDPALAYATGGWLKPVHAVLMHGILVLPLLAWAISTAGWTERTQARVLRAGIIAYAMVAVGAAAGVLIQTVP